MTFMKIYKAWKALTFDSVMLLLLYFGVIAGMTGPANLLIFISWIVLVASIALLFTNDEGVKSDLPRWISRVFFVVMVGTLVWNGWFFTGALWLGSLLITEHLTGKFEQSKNTKDPVAKAGTQGAP